MARQAFLSKTLPRKPCGRFNSFLCVDCVSSFCLCQTSHLQPFQTTMWRFKFAFHLFFVSRPSHQEHSQKAMWRFKFFFLDFPPKTFPESHMGASILFCASTAFQVFLCVKLRTKNLSRRPCGLSSFFLRRPSHQKPSQKTMWRFKFFWVSQPSQQQPSQKTM